MWTYRARLNKVIDADTADLTIDLGFHLTLTQRVRLAGIDAPEMSTPGGRLAKQWATNWLLDHSDGDWPLTITTRKGPTHDRYGRFIADIHAGAHHLNRALLEAGHAQPWPKPLSPETNSVGNAPSPPVEGT